MPSRTYLSLFGPTTVFPTCPTINDFLGAATYLAGTSAETPSIVAAEQRLTFYNYALKYSWNMFSMSLSNWDDEEVSVISSVARTPSVRVARTFSKRVKGEQSSTASHLPLRWDLREYMCEPAKEHRIHHESLPQRRARRWKFNDVDRWTTTRGGICPTVGVRGQIPEPLQQAGWGEHLGLFKSPIVSACALRKPATIAKCSTS